MPRLHPAQRAAISMDEELADDQLETLNHAVMLNDPGFVRSILAETPALRPTSESLCYLFAMPDNYRDFQETSRFAARDEKLPLSEDNGNPEDGVTFYDQRDCYITETAYADDQANILYQLLARGADPLAPAGYTNDYAGNPLDCAPAFQALVDNETSNHDIKVELIVATLARNNSWAPAQELSSFFSQMAGDSAEDINRQRKGICYHMADIGSSVKDRLAANPEAEAALSADARAFWLRPLEGWMALEQTLPQSQIYEALQVTDKATRSLFSSMGIKPRRPD